MRKISAIVAVANNYGIGKQGELLCKNSADLAFFSGFTQSKVCVVGYNTLEGLPRLPNRVLIDTGRIVSDLKTLSGGSDLVVIGGGVTYKKYAPQVEELFITKFINCSGEGADVFFCVDSYLHLVNKEVIIKNKEFIIERWWK